MIALRNTVLAVACSVAAGPALSDDNKNCTDLRTCAQIAVRSAAKAEAAASAMRRPAEVAAVASQQRDRTRFQVIAPRPPAHLFLHDWRDR